MTMSMFKFVRGDYGNYEVFLPGRYRSLGVVEKNSDRLGGGWKASVEGRTLKDGGGQVAAKFATREQASYALLRKMREETLG
jgi:hypothetical protein